MISIKNEDHAGINGIVRGRYAQYLSIFDQRPFAGGIGVILVGKNRRYDVAVFIDGLFVDVDFFTYPVAVSILFSPKRVGFGVEVEKVGVVDTLVVNVDLSSGNCHGDRRENEKNGKENN